MIPWQNRVTALTQRMADDMKLRNYSQKTIDTYTYHVGRFAQHLGKSLEQATPEDVRSFQLHLIEVRKVGWVGRPTADGSGWGRSNESAVVCEVVETSNISADSVRGGPAPERSGRPDDCRHRQPAHAATDRSRQGSERTAGATVASTVERTSRLLDTGSLAEVSVSREDVRGSSEFHHDSEGRTADCRCELRSTTAIYLGHLRRLLSWRLTSCPKISAYHAIAGRGVPASARR